MREYTPTELDWEYEREYLVFSRPAFPDAFSDRADFQRKYDAAPLITYTDLPNLTNFSGKFATIDTVRQVMGHRRDVDKVVAGLAMGTLPPPIILHRGNHMHLMSGNTRLAVAFTLGQSLGCKVIEVA